jgi:hydroxymethylpyrimidine/phosphomethylpyrimidine kinase
MAVAASLTVQSTRGVAGRHDLPPDIVRAQLEELMTDRRPDAIKTGVLGRADTIREIARLLDEHYSGPLVVDPVIAGGEGGSLIEPGGLEALVGSLVPRAALVTPNTREVAAISGFEVFDVSDMEAAALYVVRLGARAALVTGGVIEEKGRRLSADVLVDGRGVEVFTGPWLEDTNVHGTGCVLSAAITAYLALGMETREAVASGREVVRAAMDCAVSPGSGVPCANPRAAGDDGAGGEGAGC